MTAGTPANAALPRLLDAPAVAERLGISERHVQRLVAERRIPVVKVGRFIRFDPRELAEWLDSNRRPVHDDGPWDRYRSRR